MAETLQRWSLKRMKRSTSVYKRGGNENSGQIRLAFTSAFAPRRRTTMFVSGPCVRVRAFTRVFFLMNRAKKRNSRVKDVGRPQVIQLPHSSTRGRNSAKIVFELPAIHLRRLSGPSHLRGERAKDAVETGSQFDVVVVEKRKEPMEILIISMVAAIPGSASPPPQWPRLQQQPRA